MPRTESQKKADKKYAEKFFLLRVKLSFEEKELIDKHVQSTGESVSTFVRRVIADAITRESK